MLQQGVVEPSQSPWSSPVVLVTKYDGTIGFCVDYRWVNQVTHKDSYPLPWIDDTLDSLAGSVWFSSMDLCSGYWQVEMVPGRQRDDGFCNQERSLAMASNAIWALQRASNL